MRFLVNLMDDPTFLDSVEGSATDQPALRWMPRQLRALLPDQSTRTFRRRSQCAALIALRVLAEHERQVAAGNKQAPPIDVVVQELVTTITALMTAAEEG